MTNYLNMFHISGVFVFRISFCLFTCLENVMETNSQFLMIEMVFTSHTLHTHFIGSITFFFLMGIIDFQVN